MPGALSLFSVHARTSFGSGLNLTEDRGHHGVGHGTTITHCPDRQRGLAGQSPLLRRFVAASAKSAFPFSAQPRLEARGFRKREFGAGTGRSTGSITLFIIAGYLHCICSFV